jgi:hypothetical protein
VSRPRAQGSGTAGAGLPRHRITRVRFTTLDPPLWGKLHAEERCRHGKIPKSASVSEGLGCSSVVCFCTEIRSAFCIVPVQASGIFGQVRLACACLSFASACAHALIHRSCALVSLSTLYLFHDCSLALATLYLPLPHLPFFLQSTSLCTFTFKHASFYCFGIVGQEASRTLTSFLLFSPSHLPLGYCSMYGIDRIGTHLYERRCLQCGGKRLQPDRPGPFPRYPALV